MVTIVKNSLRELQEFANKNGIEKEDTIAVFQNQDGEYVLIYEEK